jgi:hypothetical protein
MNTVAAKVADMVATFAPQADAAVVVEGFTRVLRPAGKADYRWAKDLAAGTPSASAQSTEDRCYV